MLNHLKKVLSGTDLTEEEMENAMLLMTSGTVPDSQLGAFLAALHMKGESLSELVGAARMLRRHAVLIDCGQCECTDVVGTGGDGGISFNISTVSSFAAAGAGVIIAKHGNRAVSGKCGAADVLAELGFNLDVEPERMEYAVKTYGIGFLFAQKMHPLFAKVGKVRRELKVRTIFNMLGPLCNPAGANAIVLGVYEAKLTELFAAALRDLGVKRAMVVHGHDGLDEISCCVPTRVTELKDGLLKSYELFPEILLGNSWLPAEIAGGTPACNAQILRDILEGRDHGAPRAVVTMNAGAVIYTAGRAETLQEGIRLAEQSIDSGAAAEKLRILIRESQA